MHKYVGFAKDVGQISNTARTSVIKCSPHKKVFRAELDTGQEQMLVCKCKEVKYNFSERPQLWWPYSSESHVIT